MLKGYDDFEKHVKIMHWPLKSLLRCKNEPRDLSNSQKCYNWGKRNTSFGGYSLALYNLFHEWLGPIQV